MKRYTPDELTAVLAAHQQWLKDENGGTRADLTRADLRGADLTRADLRGADLTRADLTRADLRGADLRGAVLRGADLTRADLTRADLTGAVLTRAVKIKNAAVFTGLYQYIAMPVIAADGTEHICLGCHFRSTAEWAETFWNNPREFPNDGDIGSKDRWNAYQTCLRWLEDHREVEPTP